MTTTHIMLDLETWGTTPGCDIRSIGACVFDPVSGTPIVGRGDDVTMETFYIACDNPTIADWPRVTPPRYPLTRDPSTVQWWSEQSAEAQAAFADPVDLRDALLQFYLWLTVVVGDTIMGEPAQCKLWSHGPAFDPPILAAAWRVCNPMPAFERVAAQPWHYRAPRDTRTLFDAAGIDDHSAWLNQHPGPLGIEHHALDDAICQARAVCAAMARINRWRSCSDMIDDAAADQQGEFI